MRKQKVSRDAVEARAKEYLEAVKHGDNGNVIPLSERFNESKSDIRFFRISDGHAYGFTVGGKIYIEQRIATADTPIHEYAHLWASAMRKLNPNHASTLDAEQTLLHEAVAYYGLRQLFGEQCPCQTIIFLFLVSQNG